MEGIAEVLEKDRTLLETFTQDLEDLSLWATDTKAILQLTTEEQKEEETKEVGGAKPQGKHQVHVAVREYIGYTYRPHIRIALVAYTCLAQDENGLESLDRFP